MRAIKCFLVVISGVGFAGLCAGVHADEEKVPLDKLPKAVVEAMKKRFPKAEIIEAAKEMEDGKTEYGPRHRRRAGRSESRIQRVAGSAARGV
jgi:hypothetical protein